MILNFHNNKLLPLKFLFALFILVQTLNTQAQRTFTICQGEEIVLSGLTQPPQPPTPQGPPGTTQLPTYCFYGIERTIYPTDGWIERDRDSYTVAPTTTTSYTISSRSVPGPVPQDLPVTNENCLTGQWVTDQFTVIVEDCSVPACNTSDPFMELPWLSQLINLKDENGNGYSGYFQLYDVEGENYIELFPELNNLFSEIYTCDGTVFCERKDSLACKQFNESTLADTYYNTTCTVTAAEANSGDNKIDLEAIQSNLAYFISKEGSRNLNFKYKNNGPCYLYETDFVVEVNGEIIGTENWSGSVRQNRDVSVRTNLKYYFEPDTEYDMKIWPVNPNGNRDLNFSNDTVKTFFKGFKSDYNFFFDKFTSPAPIFMDGLQAVSIEFDNLSNARVKDLIYFNWSVNGEIQPPLVSEDIFYETKNVEVVLGNYYFEKGKDYEIEAWIELPELLEDKQIQDKLFYLMPTKDVMTDLGIAEVDYVKANKSFKIKIENKGNVRVDTFNIIWSVNGVQQPAIQASELNWISYTNKLTFEEYAFFNLETAAINEDAVYTLNFNIELPTNYKDDYQKNNSYAYQLCNRLNEEVDRVYTVCEGDSISLLFDEFTYQSPPMGFTGISCTTCDVVFDNPKWIFNNEIIDATTSVTIKPVHEGIYTFSTKARQTCRHVCNPPPGIGAPGAPNPSTQSEYIQDDVKVKIIVKECQKEEPDCLKNFGSTSENNNLISSFTGEYFLTFNENGEPVQFSSRYVQFDYELIGPVLTSENSFIYQPVIITCLEEKIQEDIPIMHTQYEEVCIGDQFQLPLEKPIGLGSKNDEYICDILKNESVENPSIESSFSDDCIFNFKVVNNLGEAISQSGENQENINYNLKVQTINRQEPVGLEWTFSFLYDEDCEPGVNLIFTTYPWLTDFVDPDDCAGKNVYVYDADGYEFIVLKTDLAELLLSSEGKVYCISPTGGFSFVEMYDESRIINSWACDEEYSGKLGATKVQDQGIQIFPNPANNKVFISLQKLTFEQSVISIYNVQGKQVLQTSSVDAFAGIVQLDVSDLVKGIYLVKVRTGNSIATKKLLIQ